MKSHPVPKRPATAEGEIVLCEWDDGSGIPQWVTHFHNLEDGGYYGGFYSQDFSKVESDYYQRITQYLR
ncbi:MAG: hypothetical protein WBB28_01765 [Crinalium sp.]